MSDKRASEWEGETRGEVRLINPTDNPVSDTAPYNGPSSPSINTVSPYRSPEWGDPGQDVWEYGEEDPGVEESEPREYLRNASVGYRDFAETTGWFDGTSGSIYDRISHAKTLQALASKEGAVDIESELEAEIEVLAAAASEYDQADQEEALREVPGGTVALEYDDLTDGGLLDVSFDDGSFITSTARQMMSEVEDYDWNSFSTDGAEQWIRAKIRDSAPMLTHEIVTREAAVDYVKDKTMVLMDPTRRAHIIDEFVTNVERMRRQAASQIEAEEERREHLADVEQIREHRLDTAGLGDLEENYYPGGTNEVSDDHLDEDGYLSIGEEDASPMYAEASKVVADAKERDWDDFVDQGAEEWVERKSFESPDMLLHPDITVQAAVDYAEEKTAPIGDVDERNDLIDAFVGKVSELASHYATKSRTASKKTAEEIDQTEEAGLTELEESMGEAEDEILWW